MPAASWIPKIIDSGTPSTTEPTMMPIDTDALVAEATVHDPVADEEDRDTDHHPQAELPRFEALWSPPTDRTK
jgi:hypothetical protein